jgi:hypothetical protein
MGLHASASLARKELVFLCSVQSFQRSLYNEQLQKTNSVSLSKKEQTGQVLMTHACNPSYLGGRDQEDHGSRPSWASTS